MSMLLTDNWTAIGALASCVEAVATCAMALIAVFGLLILWPQLRQIRKSVASLEVEGLGHAIEQIHDAEFQRWIEELKGEWKRGKQEYPDHLRGEIVSVMARLDYIATLVERGFIDRELLFYVFGLTFSDLNAILTNFGTKDPKKLQSTTASYPKGFDLLRQGAKWFREESQRAFARMD